MRPGVFFLVIKVCMSCSWTSAALVAESETKSSINIFAVDLRRAIYFHSTAASDCNRGVYSGGAQGVAEAVFKAYPNADVYRRSATVDRFLLVP